MGRKVSQDGVREPSTHGAQGLPGGSRVDRAGLLGRDAGQGFPGRGRRKEELQASILPPWAGHQAWHGTEAGGSEQLGTVGENIGLGQHSLAHSLTQYIPLIFTESWIQV